MNSGNGTYKAVIIYFSIYIIKKIMHVGIIIKRVRIRKSKTKGISIEVEK